MTIDPIFPMEADLEVYPEYAVGRFIMHVGDFVSAEERSRYCLAWKEELDRVLAERPPDAVFRHERTPGDALVAYARQHHFQKHEYRFHTYSGGLGMREERFELWVRQP